MTNQLDIKTLNLQECWNYFKTEIPMDTPEYRQARFGIQIHFDINDYFNDFFTVKPKSGKVFIQGLPLKTKDLYTELELRERTMKSWLTQNVVPESITIARGITT